MNDNFMEDFRNHRTGDSVYNLESILGNGNYKAVELAPYPRLYIYRVTHVYTATREGQM